MRKGEYPNNRHDALHQRAMSKWKAGGYGLDKKEPESMDIPEVCSFDTYGILHNPLRCKGILIVVQDARFGIIPVCMKHRILVIKGEIMEKTIEEQYAELKKEMIEVMRVSVLDFNEAESTARLNTELMNLLRDARNQLEYLNAKFKATGTTNALLARIDSVLNRP